MYVILLTYFYDASDDIDIIYYVLYGPYTLTLTLLRILILHFVMACVLSRHK